MSSPIVGFITARLNEVERHIKQIEAYGGCCSGCHCGCADPARLLRDVEFKRRIMKTHEVSDRLEYGDPLCTGCSDLYPCDTLRLLAQRDADHRDFDPAWSTD